MSKALHAAEEQQAIDWERKLENTTQDRSDEESHCCRKRCAALLVGHVWRPVDGSKERDDTSREHTVLPHARSHMGKPRSDLISSSCSDSDGHTQASTRCGATHECDDEEIAGLVWLCRRDHSCDRREEKGRDARELEELRIL